MKTSPSPALFFSIATAYQRTAAIKAAVELDLFSALAGGDGTVAAAAAVCGAPERSVRILCDAMTVLGFLTKEGDRYRLTPDSAFFLTRTSPGYMGGALEFLASPTLVDGFTRTADSVRRGGTVLDLDQGTVAPDHPVWVKFARAMAPMMMPAAQFMAQQVGGDPKRPLKVLDIAAGHGAFGIAIGQQFSHAEITALDWTGVLDVATENAGRAGLQDRYRTIHGSAFDVDFGTGYDLVLLTNFLHHFDGATCESLLRKIHASLADGGRVMTLEFIPNPDRISPPESAMFSLTMLVTTPSGDAYTFTELEDMFRKAGYRKSELHPIPSHPGDLVISHK